jgi:hypothetical protein
MPEEIDLNAFEGGGVRLDVEACSGTALRRARRAKEGRKVLGKVSFKQPKKLELKKNTNQGGE